MRNYVILAVALVAGMLAFFMYKVQIEREYRRLDLMGRKIKVLAARDNLVKGDTVREADLLPREIFANSATGEEVRLEDVAQIYGQKLVANKAKGTTFIWRDFEMPTLGFAGGTLARTIRRKERALSIAVDTPSSVTGMIQPNDHVDVIGTFRFPGEQQGTTLDTVSLTILQNVTVLAVGQQLATSGASAAGARPRSYPTLTLAVTPKEAEMLVFAQQKGTLMFTLRNPTDPYIESDVQSVNFDYLRRNSGKYTDERAKRLEALPAPR
jgi:pilus assembly protein CpaB